MTDRDLATALVATSQAERAARTHWEALCRVESGTATSATVPERDAALVTVRHATALKRALEQWIAARACRATLAQ